jgi:hypothetical protein
MTKDYQYINRWAKILKGIEYLGGKCVTCGENDPVLLDFHHKEKTNKKEDVSRILGAWVFKECIQELDRCVLLCAKCHRITHFDYERFNKLLPEIHLKTLNIENNNSRKKNYEKIKPDVIELLKNNKSYREITKKTGMSRNAIRNLALDNGINRADFTNKINIDENKFIELYNSGLSYPKMCEFFDISKFPLNRIKMKLIKENKILPRKGKPPNIIKKLT